MVFFIFKFSTGTSNFLSTNYVFACGLILNILAPKSCFQKSRKLISNTFIDTFELHMRPLHRNIAGSNRIYFWRQSVPI